MKVFGRQKASEEVTLKAFEMRIPKFRMKVMIPMILLTCFYLIDLFCYIINE